MYNLKIVSQVLFGDLTEEHRPGDSLSGSSEELLQRGKEGQCVCDLGEQGRYVQSGTRLGRGHRYLSS